LVSPQPVRLRVCGILFDMDGVLMSSLGSVERSWRTYAEARGLDPEQAIRLAHGRRALETVSQLMPHADPQVELLAIEDLEVADNEGIAVLPGVRKLLQSLPHDRWAIVTSATGRLARSRLAYAGLSVPDRFVSSEMVTNGKPHPEPYQRGAALLGCDPASCLVVEDAPAGVAAGKAAACKVLGVLTTHSAASLQAADWRIPTLESVQVTVLPDGGLEVTLDPLIS
jgi:sugar-phosphatase